MTQAQHTLTFHPAVGQYAHQSRHEDADYALHGIEPAYVGTKTYTCKIGTHRGQIGTPYGKLKEVEKC